MFGKMVGLTLMLLVLAGSLLMLRQQRLVIAHDNAELFWKILSTRESLWDVQARGAVMLQPQRLAMRIQTAQVAVEPVEPLTIHHPEHQLAQRDTPEWPRVGRTDIP